MLDVLTYEWLTYAFKPGVKSHTAIQSIVNAVSLFPDGILNLRLRTGNGVQYSSNDFRKSMKTLGIQQEFIWNNTPQQNRHIELLHGTIKIEYIWPHDFTRFQDAQSVLKKAIINYNHHKVHPSLGYFTLDEYACKWRDGHK